MASDLATQKTAQLSPLVLADQMITLAQQADRAGYRMAASRLIVLAHFVLDRRAPSARASWKASHSAGANASAA